MSTWESALAILGLAVITIVTRGFFMIADRELPMPSWLQQGLRYAPLAALAAVVAPEIVMGGVPDARTDQYALALTVHEVLTGYNLMAGPTPLATIFNQTNFA